jgi:hypothetical protein
VVVKLRTPEEEQRGLSLELGPRCRLGGFLYFRTWGGEGSRERRYSRGRLHVPLVQVPVQTDHQALLWKVVVVVVLPREDAEPRRNTVQA